jgi:flagellar secretion chaperone FliS
MNPYVAYATAHSSVDEDNKPKLLLKIYEAMLEKIDTVKIAIRMGKFEKKYVDLKNLVAAIEVLDSSLDMSYGEVPRNLSSLYSYLVRRLVSVHATNDIEVLDECRSILSKINEGFVGAYNKERHLNVDKDRPSDLSAGSSFSTSLV